MENDYLIREKTVLKLIGDPGRTTLWRWEKNGQFPRRRKLGGRCVAWLKSEVMEWIASRPQVGGEEQSNLSSYPTSLWRVNKVEPR